MFIDTVDTISFVCGLGFGLGDLNPGEAETITLEVDEVNCANETLLTMVTMLGEFSCADIYVACP